ncbi:MAG: type II toxin-antitoxin system prevent-host-death family antitoxin [Spirochaetes bacterium]|nr:MAG: type II toxin-antitoxin system prevent-host-death family antitoxin [Spirochaetota bacterium]
MDYLKFTDFRNHSKEYFDNVEKGSTYIIIRKGKPIARIVPFAEKTTGWKREIKKIRLRKNADTLEYIKRERDEG